MYLIVALQLFTLYLDGVVATLNTTDPDLRVGWYSGPNIRGTSDIIWSCLATIFICVWTTLHQSIHYDEGWIKRLRRKVGYMLVAILCPEYVLGNAMFDWYHARKSGMEIRKLGCSSWTITHSFYADMGGFIVNMGTKENPRMRPLDSTGIQTLVMNRSMRFPDIDEEAICDKSKADGLGKAIACVQALWLLIHCLGRAIKGLPITTLEISALAYVLGTVVTYGFWWYKPVDVMSGTEIFVKEPETRREKELLDDAFQDSFERSMRTFLNARLERATSTMPLSITQSLKHRKNAGMMITTLVATIMMLIFGGIHSLAWNFSFPSSVESLLWKISSVVLTASGASYLILNEIDELLRVRNQDSGVIFCLWVSSIFLYIIARLYLLVEPFLCLRSAPAGVYQTVEWVEFLPYFG